MSIEFLRRDAKRLLRAGRAGDSASLSRIRASLPRMAAKDDADIRATIRLADTQHAIAREHGYDNWAELKRRDDPIARCLVTVRSGALQELTAHLAEFAPLVANSIHVAAALGDRAALERHLDRDPSLATAAPDGWPPLAYVCGSPLHRLGARHSASLLECAKLLLDRGADPNTATVGDATASDTPIPVGVRAALGGNAAVAVLLTRRGASDGPGVRQAVMAMLQRSSEASPIAQIAREYFQRPEVRNAMQQAVETWRARQGLAGGHYMPLDLRELHRPKIPPLPFLNDLRTQPGVPVSAHRLARAAPAELMELVLARGIDPNSRDASGRTLLAEAVRWGNAPTADALRAAGASEADVPLVDRWLGACRRFDAADAQTIASRDPRVFTRLTAEDYDVLIGAASDNELDLLRVMLSAGIDPSGLGTSGASPLHVAAWHGHVDAVRLLIEHGARRDVRDTLYGERPLEWAIHGATRCRDADDEYRAVITALE